jgi:hypothetical protein
LKRIRPVWLSDVVVANVCFFLATPLWIVGGSLLNSHPKPVVRAWGFICAGFFFFAFAVRFWIINHRKRQEKNRIPGWVPNQLCLWIFAFGLIIYVFAVWHEEPEPRPHLKAVLTHVNGVKANLELTNTFLLFSDPQSPPLPEDIVGALFIPVRSSNDLSASLNVSLYNDSILSAGSIKCLMEIPVELRFSASGEWTTNVETGLSARLTSVLYRLKEPITAPDGEQLPEITFRPTVKGKVSPAYSTLLCARAVDMPGLNIGFKMIFTSSEHVMHPHLVRGVRGTTNKDLHFEFPKDH